MTDSERLAEIAAKFNGNGWWSAIDGSQRITNGHLFDDFRWLLTRVKELELYIHTLHELERDKRGRIDTLLHEIAELEAELKDERFQNECNANVSTAIIHKLEKDEARLNHVLAHATEFYGMWNTRHQIDAAMAARPHGEGL
jgi:hypothetical protein